MMLLNASGCLDAPTAPDVARSLDAFQNGGTRGSPVNPLLRVSADATGAEAPAGQGPAPPPAVGDSKVAR